jgi:hypothetical protein
MILNRIKEHLDRPDHTEHSDRGFLISIQRELLDTLKASKR